MGFIVWLVKFIFKITLLLIGLAGVMMLFAAMLGVNFLRDDSAIRIGEQSRGSLFDRNQQALYAQLQPRAAELNAPLSDDPSLTSFSITTAETAVSVANRLQEAGLISNAALFLQLLQYNGIDTQLQAGDYQLRRNLTMRQIGAALYRGRSSQQVVTIFAGWRLEQIAQSLHMNGIMDANQFYRVAAAGTHVNHPLLADRPAGQSYEGYLFPGTYYLLDNTTPTELIQLMLDSMARHLPPNYQELAQQQGLTFYEVLTVASIVEREAALDSERPLIASVYLNRLRGKGETRLLQADPTVQYAMGYQEAANQWWKSPVALEEYSGVDSPYNTYLYPGLPPGPIASPSLESIEAVLQPAQTDYLFFVCASPGCSGGNHVFATSYDEHLQNVAAYYGQ